MQRVGAAGGPGPIGFQGPPRSLKISPVNIQDEPTDPTQSKYKYFTKYWHADIGDSDTKCDISFSTDLANAANENIIPLFLSTRK
ncbi:hypothetical protein X777_08913 [Ooceraea biroi]|uniref:Uncharacterized protein n=1 Tax=Ooceraea biroi TaxID=2015173 RepID=A0A026W8F0_OOCBI|nr:hypothetical protein X777_08913 [Ooceraea biroi]